MVKRLVIKPWFSVFNICSIYEYFYLVFYVIENCLCNIIVLYSTTFVLCVQRIVEVTSISKCMFYLFLKQNDKIVWIFLVVGFIFHMTLKNSRFLTLCTKMGRKCYFLIFQHGVGLILQLLHSMLLFWIVYLQIGGSWARFPTSGTRFVLNGDMLSRFIDCFSCCSIAHNMLMVIIDDSSTTMTCAFLKCSMILLSSRRMDKHLHVGIWNVVCIVLAIEFKWSAITPMVVNNNTFLPSNWKFCVNYFKKKFLPLWGVFVTICKPYGFSIMKMCMSNVCCEGLKTSCILFGCLLWKT